MKRLIFVLILFSALVVSGISPERSEAQQPPNLTLVRVFIDLPSRATLSDRVLVNNLGGNVRRQFATSNTISIEIPQASVDALTQVSNRFFNVRLEPKATAVEDTLDWGVSRIDAERVWGGAEGAVNVTGNGGSGRSVAVVDTGISSHPDLIIAGGLNFVANPDNTNYADDNGHGTHVAGTIAALDNGSGQIGVAPQASIYALKVLNAEGSGNYGDIIAAVEWATGLNGGTKVDVINMSLGCFTTDVDFITGRNLCDDPAFQAAIDNAYAAGVLVIVAAGNNGPSANTLGYPALYNSAIAVAATDSNNNVASFSSRGAKVELAAPGVNIRSTSSAGSYVNLNGTSMATPHVAGLAALIKAANPSMTASQIRTRMQQTTTDLGTAGRDTSYGYGLVNAVAAVDGGTPPPPPPASFLACTQQAPVTSSSGDNNGYQTSPLNACNDNSVFAVDTNSGSGSSTSCTSTSKDRHIFYNFNATLNSGATISGIEVRLDARVESSFSSPSLCVQLSSDGGATWTSAKRTSTLSTSEQSYILGSASDSWGRNWTAANLANSSFRVRVTNSSSSTSRDFSLDFVGLRVTSSGGAPIVPDTTAPTVTSTSPLGDAIAVATNTQVRATFSEAMDPATINGSSFTVRPTSSGTNLAGSVSYLGNTATFTPSSALAMNTNYTATVTTAVRDANGVAMATTRTWDFTTVQDSGAPTVTAMSPTSGSTGVAANSTIRATFSEPMNESSVETAGRFVVRVTIAGANVGGTVVYANNVATFTPSSPLASNTNYTVTLSTSMTDIAGNALTLPGSWTFTTAAGPQSCAAPVIVSHSDTSPSGGGTVSFSWNPVPGTTSYRIQRASLFSWTTVTTVTGTSYTGSDASNDPSWRISAYTGTCTPMPGPATTFDP